MFRSAAAKINSEFKINMCCKSFWKRIISFGLALALGLFAAAVLQKKSSPNVKPVNPVTEGSGRSGADFGPNDPRNFQGGTLKSSDPASTMPVQILSKPRAYYTDAARLNFTEGKVVLRVTFSANGQIGAISVITGLSDGLTEQAVAAAKGIKFEPARRDGVPYSVTKPVEYTFTIY
jgi:TonB family protein